MRFQKSFQALETLGPTYPLLRGDSQLHGNTLGGILPNFEVCENFEVWSRRQFCSVQTLPPPFPSLSFCYWCCLTFSASFSRSITRSSCFSLAHLMLSNKALVSCYGWKLWHTLLVSNKTKPGFGLQSSHGVQLTGCKECAGQDYAQLFFFFWCSCRGTSLLTGLSLSPCLLQPFEPRAEELPWSSNRGKLLPA